MEKCRLVYRFSVRYALSVTCINVMPLHSEFETTVLPSSSSYWLPLQTFQRSRKKENLIHGAILSMICCFNVKVASVLKMNTKGCWKVAERLNMATLPAPLLTTLYYKPCFSETVWELERKEKRKSQGKKGREERKKNNGCTLSFYNGRFGDSFWRKKKAVGHKGPICWWPFWKIRLHIMFIHFFLPGVDGLFSQARRLDHKLHQCPQKSLHSFLVIRLSERVQLVWIRSILRQEDGWWWQRGWQVAGHGPDKEQWSYFQGSQWLPGDHT